MATHQCSTILSSWLLSIGDGIKLLAAGDFAPVARFASVLAGALPSCLHVGELPHAMSSVVQYSQSE
eukprot:scaffold11521_cov18-Prasinocladus_malaysianus.AAC.1